MRLRCPRCRSPFRAGIPETCPVCGAPIPVVEGAPALVPDVDSLLEHLAAARRSEGASWYEASQVDAWSGPYRHHLAKRRALLDAELRRRFPVPVGDAVDMGCGDGANLAWLSGHAERLWASDFNPLRLARARSHGVELEALYLADITDYPAENDSFDLVFLNHVLEHVPDDVAALAEVARVTRPGGLVVIGVPNEGASWWQLAYRLQPHVRRTTDHVHFYDAPEVVARCERAGLTVEQVDAIGWGIPHWTADAVVRRFKLVDDVLEAVGRRVVPNQATSLYLFARPTA